MARYSPTYEDYLRNGQIHGSTQEGEGGPMVFNPRYTEQEWEAMSDAERHQAVPRNEMNALEYDVAADDPIFAQFREQFGDAPEGVANSGFELGNQRQTGLAIGYGDGPRFGEAGWDQLAIDPSRIMYLDPEGTPNRRYVYERENQRADAVVGEQAREDDSGLGDNFWIVGLATVIGGGLLANTLSSGTLAGVPEAGAATGATPGATPAASAAVPAATPATSGIVSAEQALAASAAAGEVTTAAPLIAAPGAAPTTGLGGWWGSLSPSSQQLLTRAGLSAAGQGASAILGASRQEDAENFARERQDEAARLRREEEDRARTERETRGSRTRLNIPTTPRGLVNSQRSG